MVLPGRTRSSSNASLQSKLKWIKVVNNGDGGRALEAKVQEMWFWYWVPPVRQDCQSGRLWLGFSSSKLNSPRIKGKVGWAEGRPVEKEVGGGGGGGVSTFRIACIGSHPPWCNSMHGIVSHARQVQAWAQQHVGLTGTVSVYDTPLRRGLMAERRAKHLCERKCRRQAFGVNMPCSALASGCRPYESTPCQSSGRGSGPEAR